MGFFRKLKRVFCAHRRTAGIFKSRRYSTIQEMKVDFWRDSIVGIECLDCGLKITIQEFDLGRYPYSGEPHYETTD